MQKYIYARKNEIQEYDFEGGGGWTSGTIPHSAGFCSGMHWAGSHHCFPVVLNATSNSAAAVIMSSKVGGSPKNIGPSISW